MNIENPVVVVASRSKHKVEEIRRMIGDCLEVRGGRFIDLDEAEKNKEISVPEVVEDATTFSKNAEKKAKEVSRATGMWALADDSGLCVDALGGAPGVQSARYSGVEGEGRDEANNQKLIREMENIPDEERGASFRCALCLASPEGKVWNVEGRCLGKIAYSASGTGGFGYDPLFITLETGLGGLRTHAELTPAEKDRVSHRGRALRAMRVVLEDVFGIV